MGLTRSPNAIQLLQSLFLDSLGYITIARQRVNNHAFCAVGGTDFYPLHPTTTRALRIRLKFLTHSSTKRIEDDYYHPRAY
jgi:hypothetical protein